MRVVHTARHWRHDPRCEIESSTLQTPFEHGGRADAIRRALGADPMFDLVTPDEWGVGPIEAVHDRGLVRFLERAWAEYQDAVGPTREVVPDVFSLAALRRGLGPSEEPATVHAQLGWWCFETTTPLVAGTYDAARAAVDTALTAARLVLDGDRAAYGLCRPPGHHAATALYGGYCFFNNAAIAAHHLVGATGGRVSVLDVDYHHGNGTQEICYDRADVQYVSLHADPARAYPFVTGFADEVGTGSGRGSTLNLPLPAGTDDDAYLSALARAVDAVGAFDPAAVVVSLGLDTYAGDPIADLALTAEGFERCGALVRELDRPTVVLQEGGYAVNALGENARRWLRGLAGVTPP